MSMAGRQTAASPLEQFRALYRDRFAASMQSCEELLGEAAARPAGILSQSCSFTLAAGGKRLRPLLVFLSARRESPPPGAAQLAAAAAVELVHMATLVHDDVIDGAELRRGQPTLVSRHGRRLSTGAGDYLFSTAFDLLAGTGEPAAVSLLSRASLALSLGELMQMRETANYGLAPAAYFERCRHKTSGLFAAACQLGAMLSGCSPAAIAAMGSYADNLGLSFQLADDILDFEGDPARTGKRIGADLRDGTVTLPLILAMERDPEICGLLAGGVEERIMNQACERIIRCGALEDAREQAAVFAARARAALQGAAAEIDAEPLALIAAATVDRKA